jgi:hypothetical protein
MTNKNPQATPELIKIILAEIKIKGEKFWK